MISAKSKKSDVFSYFIKAKGDFLARGHTISLNKGFLNTSSFEFVPMQMCACLKEHMRVDYLHGLPRQRSQLESSRLQQPKHTTSAKHLGNWDWSVFKCSDKNVVFQTAIFLILVVRNNTKSSGIDGKISYCYSRNCFYYRYLELRFC